MREAIIAFAMTLTLLWLGTFVSRQFSVGIAVGVAYVAILMLIVGRRAALANSTEGRSDRA
jgi:ABC-type nickel/cobalt efflux system permease component RcnA